ncbi:MAG TPA: cytochrome c [Polyangia bacterium]|nr:cytochrome c [Polyangia bacterium]
MRAVGLLLAALAIGCGRRAGTGGTTAVDGDRAAFALQLIRTEYREQTENGSFTGVPALVAVLDGARADLSPRDQRAGWLRHVLDRIEDALLRHAPPRTVARMCTEAAAQLASHGIRLSAPVVRPDLARGASLYRLACFPCHGPPNGPPPPAAAHLIPRPPRPLESAVTPYELFNRITYGGAGTAMPSFAETLSASDRWDIAFHLFADRWPPCASARWPPLPATALAHMSDADIWRTDGWGAAACQRRNFR